jgi:secreted PhoX family phosphatase
MLRGIVTAQRSRRWFLTSTTAIAAVVPFAQLFTRRAWARDYGPLVPDPNGLLDLPEGFSYIVVESEGDTMDDGFEVPGGLDGMACFAGASGTLVLMRNHEITDSSGNEPDEMYDPEAGGGVTRIVVDARTGARISSNWVLAGTRRNCAGGPSPWGWLTCEENVDSGHGYVFVTDPTAESVQPPVQIVGYGRFNHEAAAVDPATSICWLTEDNGGGCLYRFVPDDPSEPFVGTLQAMRVTTEDEFDTGEMIAGDMVEIDWVDITEPDPAGDTVRVEAHDAGAATVVRGEGIWFHDGAVYFTATSGGPMELGQVFRLVDGPNGGTLECIADSLGPDHLSSPDNITVAPWGQVFIAEDADGTCFIRAITDAGEVVPFARNAQSDSELAGVCFSPDGRILFVNAQSDGLTFAITGPFPELPDPGGEDTGGTDDDTGADESGSDDGTDGSTGDDGSAGASAGEGATSATVGEGSAGTDTSGGDSAGSGDDEGDGCGCQATPSRGTGIDAVLAALAFARRRTAAPPDDAA